MHIPVEVTTFKLGEEFFNRNVVKLFAISDLRLTLKYLYICTLFKIQQFLSHNLSHKI